MNKDVEYIWDEKDRLVDADELETDCPIAGERRPQVEPGQYEANCVKTILSYYGRERKLLILFQLCGGKYDGLKLFLPCPFPKGKRGYRTKYYQLWTIANGAPPKGCQRMARHVFTGKKYRILVGNSSRRFENGELKPESLQYSIVKEILEVIHDDYSN